MVVTEFAEPFELSPLFMRRSAEAAAAVRPMLTVMLVDRLPIANIEAAELPAAVPVPAAVPAAVPAVVPAVLLSVIAAVVLTPINALGSREGLTVEAKQNEVLSNKNKQVEILYFFILSP